MKPKKKGPSKRGGGKKTPPFSKTKGISSPLHKSNVKSISMHVKNNSPVEVKNAVIKVEGGSSQGLPVGDIPAHSSKVISGPMVEPDGVISLEVSKETMDDIMNKDEPKFKKAGDITKEDDLKFELGRLRTFLTVFNTYVEHEGNLYYVQVDPLNKMVKFLGVGEGPDEAGQKVVEQFKENAGPYSPEATTA